VSSLRAMIEHVSGMAEAMFDPDDILAPHYYAENGKGQITLVAVLASGRDLDRMRADIALRFKLERYRRWVFFSEAWAVEYDAGAKSVEPSKHPERMEVIQFQALDIATDRALRARRQILRLGEDVKLMPLHFGGPRAVDVPAATEVAERTSA